MRLELQNLELSGVEVVLRPLQLDDAEALAAASAESREPYGFTVVPDGLEDTQKHIARALQFRDAGIHLPFTILWRNRIVGMTRYMEMEPWLWPEGHPLQRTDRPDAVEIGHTWLATSAQRTRCNTEAKYLLLTNAFDTWDVHRVALRTDERNEQSRRAIERLGAQYDGLRRAEMPGRDGTVRNSVYYSILRAEWPAVRTRLQEFLDADHTDSSSNPIASQAASSTDAL